jgi:hypothetical protein
MYLKLPLPREIRGQLIPALVPTLERLNRISFQALQIQQELYYQRLMMQQRYQDSKRLLKFECQVYSQHGEDGIIREILRRIGSQNKRFLEIGVEGGLENNTAFLLAQGWSGVWVEGSGKWCNEIRKGFKKQLDSGRLQLIEAFVTQENVRTIVEHVPDVDVLSLDVDLNTYYIWDGLAHIKARLVVIEYNGMIPADMDWSVRYAPDQSWDGSSYMGASLKAYERLGKMAGYVLVGCDTSGTNAFFVREDLAGDRFLMPFTAEEHFEPARYFLDRQNGHRRGYAEFLNTDETGPRCSEGGQ